MELIKKFEILKIGANGPKMVEDEVIVEYNFALFINGQHFSDIMCTPSDLKALVYGTLFTRGLIHGVNDLKDLQIGVSRVDALAKRINCTEPATTNDPSREIVLELEDLFQAVQTFEGDSPLFVATGGVHSCALYQLGKENRIFMEDLGRHNAVDKAFGQALLEGWDLAESFLITSGRVPGDLVTKALNTGLPIIVSRSAPTDQAVELARRANITLCGFARGRRLNIYSAPNRIKI